MLNSDKPLWKFAITIYSELKTNYEYTGIPPYFMFILLLCKAVNVSMIHTGTGRVCSSLDQVLQVSEATRPPGYSLSMPGYEVVRRGSHIITWEYCCHRVCHSTVCSMSFDVDRSYIFSETKRSRKRKKGNLLNRFAMGFRLMKLRCCEFDGCFYVVELINLHRGISRNGPPSIFQLVALSVTPMCSICCVFENISSPMLFLGPFSPSRSMGTSNSRHPWGALCVSTIVYSSTAEVHNEKC